MTFIRQLIGGMTLLLVGLVYVVGEILTWVSVETVARLAPRRRDATLLFWVTHLRDATVRLMWMAGARFDVRLRVPCEGGILLVCNHQSLIDIPVGFKCVENGYPLMLPHQRYMKGIPLVSYMLRAGGHIPVYPGRTGAAELERLREQVRAADKPVLIYPEGHRTRDGEIRPWKRAGLESILGARKWTVHVLVLDGLWHSARIHDFIRTIATVRCRGEAVGPFEYDGAGRESHTEFIDRIEKAMCDKLAEMRRNPDVHITRPFAGAESVVSR